MSAGFSCIVINVVESNDGSCNGFSHWMKRQSIVALVELGMWNCRAIHHCLVIPNHVSFLVDRDTQIVQGVLEINLLIHTYAGSNEF